MEFLQALANRHEYELMVHVVLLVAKEKENFEEIQSFFFLSLAVRMDVYQLDFRVVFVVFAFDAFDP